MPDGWKRRVVWIALSAACAALPAAAGVTRDGSIGPANAPLDVPPGSDSIGAVDYLISADLGEKAGPNLFHSFSDYSIAQGEIASFTGPPDVDLVYIRDTSGRETPMNGLTRSDIDGVHLMFFNPFGVLIGPNGQVDVNGSFTVSTADYVAFQDAAGTVWPTGTPTMGLLSVAQPAAFGFLNDDSNGSIVIDHASGSGLPLTVGGSQPRITLVGGDIVIKGRSQGSAIDTIRLENGTVEMASVRGEVEVPFDIASFDASSLDPSQRGEIRMSDVAIINVAEDADVDGDEPAPPGGRVVIRGGTLVMEGQSRITAGVVLEQDATPLAVDLDLADLVHVTEGSEIRSTTSWSRALSGTEARSGDVKIRSRRLVIDDRGTVFTRSSAYGRAGDVILDVGDLEINDSGELKSVTQSGPGRGGDLEIRAGGDVEVEGTGSILTLSGVEGCGRCGATGTAGDIRIEAGGVRVSNGAGISSLALKDGVPGAIEIDAVESIEVTGGGSLITSASTDAPGQNVTLSAESIEVTDGGVISTDADGVGKAGDLILTAGSVLLDGALTGLTAAGRDGDGGSISIFADSLSVGGGAEVRATTFGSGNAGSILVDAKFVDVDGRDEIGNPSSILAQSKQGRGAAGSVTVIASEALSISNGGQISVSSASENSGPTGSIDIRAGSVSIRDSEDAVKAESLDQPAGNISIRAADRIEIIDGSISTVARTGGGGNIEIRSRGSILFRRSAPNFDDAMVDAQVEGNVLNRGGDVMIAAEAVAMDTAGLRARASAGLGGSIEIEAESFVIDGGVLVEESPGIFLSGNSWIDVSGGLESGFFVIRSPDSAVVSQVTALADDFLDVTRLAMDQCAARDEPTGSLVVRGRDRVPAAPGRRLPLPYPRSL